MASFISLTTVQTAKNQPIIISIYHTTAFSALTQQGIRPVTSSSAVTYEPAQRAASRQMAKL